MTLEETMAELKALGSEQTKKTYMNHGAREPLFGVTTGAMKPLAKKIKNNQILAEQLYKTGNYDAMYFAGMIADTDAMTEGDFEAWMDAAYCHGLSDYVVAVMLAKTHFAQTVADQWIESGKELHMSAGWCCYCLLLSILPNDLLEKGKLKAMLIKIKKTIHNQPNRTRYSMNSFIIAAGISYFPLHDEAVKTAEDVGKVTVNMGATYCKVPFASVAIEKAAERRRVGYKQK